MTPWRIEIERGARKNLDLLPEQDRRALLARLAHLAHGEPAVDVRKLQGRSELYRVRSGRWRAILTFDAARHAIIVVDVDDRKDAYR